MKTSKDSNFKLCQRLQALTLQVGNVDPTPLDGEEVDKLFYQVKELIPVVEPPPPPPVDDSIYIDTNFTGQGKGTQSEPFKAMPALVSNTSYKVKSGSTIPNIRIDGKEDIVIAAYGDGVKPKIRSTAVCSLVHITNSKGCHITGFDITGGNNTVACIQTNTAHDCGVHYSDLSEAHHSNNNGFGLHMFYSNNFELIGCTIKNVALDGIYAYYCLNFKVIGCHISKVNQRYFTNSSEAGSSGDGIQLNGDYNGFEIKDTTIDRSDPAGNKFAIILNSNDVKANNATGVIDNCIIKINGSLAYALLMIRGKNIQVLNSQFVGVGGGLAIRAQSEALSNTKIKNCTFTGFDRGVSVAPRWAGNTPFPPIGTVVEDCDFSNIKRYHISLDNTAVVSTRNTHTRVNTNDKGVAIWNYGKGQATITGAHYSEHGMEGSFGAGTNPTYGV